MPKNNKLKSTTEALINMGICGSSYDYKHEIIRSDRIPEAGEQPTPPGKMKIKLIKKHKKTGLEEIYDTRFFELVYDCKTTENSLLDEKNVRCRVKVEISTHKAYFHRDQICEKSDIWEIDLK